MEPALRDVDAPASPGRCSWRAVEERRFVVPAAVLVAATAAFHFETGYLAFAGVVVFVLARPAATAARRGRARASSAPAARFGSPPGRSSRSSPRAGGRRSTSSSNPARRRRRELLRRTAASSPRSSRATCSTGTTSPSHARSSRSGFVVLRSCAGGARRRASPTIGAGRGPSSALFAARLVLFFGRPTLGPLLDLAARRTRPLPPPLPRRRAARRLCSSPASAPPRSPPWASPATGGWRVARPPWPPLGQSPAARTSPWSLALALLVPAWSFVVAPGDAERVVRRRAVLRRARPRPSSTRSIATIERARRRADLRRRPVGLGRSLHRRRGAGLQVPRVARRRRGRLHAPDRVADERSGGRVRRRRTRPTTRFRRSAGCSSRSAMNPPVPARLVERRGPYALWEIPGNGYVEVVDTRGTRRRDSSATSARSPASFLAGLPSGDPVSPTVAYGGAPAAPGTLRGRGRARRRPGDDRALRRGPRERARSARPSTLRAPGRRPPLRLLRPGLAGAVDGTSCADRDGRPGARRRARRRPGPTPSASSTAASPTTRSSSPSPGAPRLLLAASWRARRRPAAGPGDRHRALTCAR